MVKWVKVVKGYKFPLTRKISPGDTIYGLVTTVNNTVSYIWKLIRE